MLMASCCAPPTPNTSITDTTTGHQRATEIDEARLLSPHHHFLIQGKNRGSGSSVKWQPKPCAYQKDTNRKDQGRALLDKSSTPLVRDEDSPAITDATAPAADGVDGTYKTPNK
jgi:hypothetical protein